LLCYNKNMSRYYDDTHPDMEALQIKLLREVPPWQKIVDLQIEQIPLLINELENAVYMDEEMIAI
jgi:hypothetical protein